MMKDYRKNLRVLVLFLNTNAPCAAPQLLLLALGATTAGALAGVTANGQ